MLRPPRGLRQNVFGRRSHMYPVQSGAVLPAKFFWTGWLLAPASNGSMSVAETAVQAPTLGSFSLRCRLTMSHGSRRAYMRTSRRTGRAASPTAHGPTRSRAACHSHWPLRPGTGACRPCAQLLGPGVVERALKAASTGRRDRAFRLGLRWTARSRPPGVAIAFFPVDLVLMNHPIKIEWTYGHERVCFAPME